MKNFLAAVAMAATSMGLGTGVASASPTRAPTYMETQPKTDVNGQVLVPSFGQVKVPTPWVIQAVLGRRPPPL